MAELRGNYGRMPKEIRRLERYCRSKDLSFDGIKCALGYFVPHDRLHESNFLHRVCMNRNVTLEIVEYLIEIVGTKRDILERSYEGDTLLDVACGNEHCPNSVVKFLMDSSNMEYPRGLPLHSYLYRRQNIDVEIVKYMVEKYPDALLLVEEYQTWRYALHTACENEHCPNSVVKFLLESHIDLLKCTCILETEFEFHPGLPLHHYLYRRQNVDIEIVKYMVEEYPDALLLVGDSVSFTPLHLLVTNKHAGAMFDIVKYLVDYEPMSLRCKDLLEEKELPLHYACKNQSITKEIIQYFIDKWPEALQEGNDSGETPLHLFCQYGDMIKNNDAIEILQVLLGAYSDVAIQANRNVSNPINLAAGNDMMSIEVLKVLINARPELVEESGDLPIHDACSSGHIDIVKYLYGLYPDSIRAFNCYDESPLHCACRNKNPEILKYVFGLYPEAIHLRGERGLPIHVASWRGAAGEHTKELIEFLMTHDPDCLLKADHQGCLPLHIFSYFDLKCGAALLFDLHPEAILVSDEDGRLPLDVARVNTRCKELISFLDTQQNYALTARDTAAMTTPDENGLLPLHRALHHNAPLGSIKLLLRGNPDAINVAEPNGLLPLQLACECCSLGVVKYLTGIIGECSSLCDGDDNYLLHYACRGGNVDVVRCLLEKGHIRAVSVKNKDEKLPIDLLNEFVRKNQSEEHDVKYVDIIWHLLLADPETILQNYCGNKQLA